MTPPEDLDDAALDARGLAHYKKLVSSDESEEIWATLPASTKELFIRLAFESEEGGGLPPLRRLRRTQRQAVADEVPCPPTSPPRPTGAVEEAKGEAEEENAPGLVVDVGAAPSAALGSAPSSAQLGAPRSREWCLGCTSPQRSREEIAERRPAADDSGDRGSTPQVRDARVAHARGWLAATPTDESWSEAVVGRPPSGGRVPDGALKATWLAGGLEPGREWKTSHTVKREAAAKRREETRVAAELAKEKRFSVAKTILDREAAAGRRTSKRAVIREVKKWYGLQDARGNARPPQSPYAAPETPGTRTNRAARAASRALKERPLPADAPPRREPPSESPRSHGSHGSSASAKTPTPAHRLDDGSGRRRLGAVDGARGRDAPERDPGRAKLIFGAKAVRPTLGGAGQGSGAPARAATTPAKKKSQRVEPGSEAWRLQNRAALLRGLGIQTGRKEKQHTSSTIDLPGAHASPQNRAGGILLGHRGHY